MMKIRRLPSFFLSYVLIPKQQTEDKYHPPLLSLLWRPIVQETFLLYYNLLKRTAEPTNNVITPYGLGHRCCLLHAHKTNIGSVSSQIDPVPFCLALFCSGRPADSTRSPPYYVHQTIPHRDAHTCLLALLLLRRRRSNTLDDE